jgi:hypothetical protein
LPLACAAAIILSVMPAKINLGIRHILPVFPFVAMQCGATLAAMFDSKRWAYSLAAGILVYAQFAGLLNTHPEHISYFNLLAGSEPENVRVDSDLDWGQDVARLGPWLKGRGITGEVGLSAFGSTDPSRHGLEWYPVSPWERAKGWIVVSATSLKLAGWDEERTKGERAWWWLKELKPEARLGGLLLYRVP